MRPRRQFQVLVAVAVVGFLVVVTIQSSMLLPKSSQRNSRHNSVLRYSDETRDVPSSSRDDIPEVFAAENDTPFDPPLGVSEVHVDIDFNKDRLFSFGQQRRIQHAIPKLIHFMWKNEYIPSVFVENLKSFIKYNSNWNFFFWTDATSEQFLKDHYPELLSSYSKFNMNVSRSDALRYAIIHHYGGAYFDLDTECFKPLDILTETEECILAPEPMEHAVVVINLRSLLGNCVMLCKPKHSFFSHVLSQLKYTNHAGHFMDSAGPIFFGKAFNSYVNTLMTHHPKPLFYDAVHIMSSEYFLDHVKQGIHAALSDLCPKYAENFHPSELKKNRHLMLEACHAWAQRGGTMRGLSPAAFTAHQYFGTYNNAKMLDNKEENHIRNIIPVVQQYPFV